MDQWNRFAPKPNYHKSKYGKKTKSLIEIEFEKTSSLNSKQLSKHIVAFSNVDQLYVNH
jgi:hypothetical protein